MKVRIYQPHTHAGVLHVPGPAGIELDVSQPDAEFLKHQGVLDPPLPPAQLRETFRRRTTADPAQP